jgi:ATP-dependent DNA helicase RecG
MSEPEKHSLSVTEIAPAKTVAEQLATPVQFLKGVGAQRAELLARLGLFTARDVLFYFPRDYQDLTELGSLAELEENLLVRLRGKVLEVDQRVTSSGRVMLGVLVGCTSGNLRALWFNQPFMFEKFSVGQEVLLSGKAQAKGGMWQMVHPQVQWIEREADEPGGNLLPVYGLTEGLRQGHMRRIVRGALDAYADLLEEVFPEEFLRDHQLRPIAPALRSVHFPADREDLATARRRFVYQELFILQLALATKRRQLHDLRQAPPLDPSAKIDARIRRLFPFELTAGQNRAIDEIKADMAQPHPMNRLLQGDVGSGKTMVAMYGILLAVAHGQQAALMAPTEILARQHADTLGALLSSSHVRWACLTGGIAAAERREILAQLKTGELDVVLGTQAMLQADVEFARLALVVIDEQHKFGVRQRASLKQAALDPHYLVMTATPIPRTVAMTLFGDLDVSTLRDAPPGRQQVHTYLAEPEQRERWWEFFRKKLREGRQGYVIAPLVASGENDEVDAASDDLPEDDVAVHDEAVRPPLAGVMEMYESLANGPLEAFRLGLIHGRLSSAEKEAAMADFRSGKTQVLVSTTVIEVGVDVPNATLLTIESGHRFGLSQLHQLRGRVSRGTHPGFCTVFADTSNELSRQRLEAFVATNDGFELAEVDFRLRGPGDLLGTKQHGLPPLRIANLALDTEVLDECRRDAHALVAADPDLGQSQHDRLRRMTLARYGRVLNLGDVG